MGNLEFCRTSSCCDVSCIIVLTITEKAIHGETAVHVAFASDKADCVRYLLSAGANVDGGDRCIAFFKSMCGNS